MFTHDVYPSKHELYGEHQTLFLKESSSAENVPVPPSPSSASPGIVLSSTRTSVPPSPLSGSRLSRCTPTPVSERSVWHELVWESLLYCKIFILFSSLHHIRTIDTTEWKAFDSAINIGKLHE